MDVDDLLARCTHQVNGHAVRLDRAALAAKLPRVEADPDVVAATEALDAARAAADQAVRDLRQAETAARKADGILAQGLAAGKELLGLRKLRAAARDDEELVDLARRALAVAAARVDEAEQAWEAATAAAGDRIAADLRTGLAVEVADQLREAQRRCAALAELDRALLGAISLAGRSRPILVDVLTTRNEYRRDGRRLTAPVPADEVEVVPVTERRRVPLAEARSLVASGQAAWVDSWRTAGGADGRA